MAGLVGEGESGGGEVKQKHEAGLVGFLSGAAMVCFVLAAFDGSLATIPLGVGMGMAAAWFWSL